MNDRDREDEEDLGGARKGLYRLSHDREKQRHVKAHPFQISDYHTVNNSVFPKQNKKFLADHGFVFFPAFSL